MSIGKQLFDLDECEDKTIDTAKIITYTFEEYSFGSLCISFMDGTYIRIKSDKPLSIDEEKE